MEAACRIVSLEDQLDDARRVIDALRRKQAGDDPEI